MLGALYIYFIQPHTDPVEAPASGPTPSGPFSHSHGSDSSNSKGLEGKTPNQKLVTIGNEIKEMAIWGDFHFLI